MPTTPGQWVLYGVVLLLVGTLATFFGGLLLRRYESGSRYTIVTKVVRTMLRFWYRFVAWMPYMIAFLLAVIGARELSLPTARDEVIAKDPLPWVIVTVLAVFLLLWTKFYRHVGMRTGVTQANTWKWGESSVVLQDQLSSPETRAGGFIPAEKTHKVTYKKDGKRKVLEIGDPDQYVRYSKQLPLVEGTVKISMKLQDRSVGGVILGTSTHDGAAEPDFVVALESDGRDRYLSFTYRRDVGNGGNKEELLPKLTYKGDLQIGNWYQLAVTWGPSGMKIAVDGSVADEALQFTDAIYSGTTHFGIGNIYCNEKAAANLLLRDLTVTDIQEF